MEQHGPVDLHLHTATGVRVVRVEPGEHAYASGGCGDETEFDPAADAKPGVLGPVVGRHGDGDPSPPSPIEDAPWLVGLNRLADPSALSRFVVSRTLYRRLGRYAWWLLVPFGVAALLRVAVTPWVLGHLGSGLPARAIRHAHQADLGDQIVIAAAVALVVLAVLAWSSASSAVGCGRSSAVGPSRASGPRAWPTTPHATPAADCSAGAMPD